ncbi:MAG: hypothetical protein LBB89_03620 [Treponema sp.]|jgi:guanylate kinase|nr:hypothetical protein [Treponema sp.]
MRTAPFIITLTGSPGCGKTHFTNKIIEIGEKLKYDGIQFKPKRHWKYVTRPYRETEINEQFINNKDSDNWVIDVKSTRNIPEDCEFIYRTYGDEYGFKKKDLQKYLNKGESPIIVINDVRVVEELKSKFPNQVLSLFLFREIIPDFKTQQKIGETRGSVSEIKIISRFERAVALYRIFIENITLFDRVILNVPYQETFEDIAEIQAKGVISGVINEKILLNKKIIKTPKLFIVSGNAQSGKDDIIRAAKNLGKLQTDILKKHTTRWAEDGDEGEIICKFIPKSNLLQQYENEYLIELNSFEKEYSFEEYMNNEDWKTQNKDKEEIRVKFETDKLSNKNKIKTGRERFWIDLRKTIKEKQEAAKDNSTEKDLSENAYKEILSLYFESNPEYIDLERIVKENEQKYKDEINKIDQRIKSMQEHNSGCLQYEGTPFVLYENNQKLYGNPIYYGYELEKYIKRIKNGNRHIVLTASLPNMFRICREHFGKENVITAYTFSQISKKEHIENSINVTGPAKLQEYNDILRYASHIEDFDYALIFAETSAINKSGNQKDELVDQMFRLFREYNSDTLKENKKKLFVLSGPSGIGKSTLLSKIVENGLCAKASKYSSRKKRETTFDDITSVDKDYIEKNCDIKYDMYGNSYGFIIEEMGKRLNNENLVVICRHVKSIKKMKKYFDDKISIIFIYLQDIFVENLLKAYVEREGLKYDDQLLLPLAKNISQALKTKNKLEFSKLNKEFIKKMKNLLGIQFKYFYERYETMIYSDKYYVRNKNLFDHTILGENIDGLFDEFYKILIKQEYM